MILMSEGIIDLFVKPPDDREKVAAIIQELWLQIRFHIKEYKEVCDSLTHPDIEIVKPNPDHRYFLEVLNRFIKRFSLMSMQVQSLMKMAIEVELPAKKVREDYLKNGDPYAPAFLDRLVAEPDLSSAIGRTVRAYFEDSWKLLYSDENWKKRHPNAGRMIRLIRKYFRKYMDRLEHKIYTLTNGSATRFEDGTDIKDINGIVYITKQEQDAVENRWNEIIKYFKVLNFDEDISYVVVESGDYYGTINVAPDDSGKTRISYCIDPVVQVISKAVAKCLDYVSRKLPSNCTKDQMRIVRKILKEQWNQKAYILSLDMSKYSDTLQFKWILKMLNIMGIPELVCKQIEDLYTLPMYDKVKGVVTPRTKASYQGQYGDFSMITLLNVWTQCNIFDFFGEYYELEDESRINGGAVGDDTIMVFMRQHDQLFEAARQFYANLGVNINRTKTHTLFAGQGTADFIKRFITAEGLIPYIRLAPFFTLDKGSWIEELLRFQRSNNMYDLFSSLCDLVLDESESLFTKNLHVLNGGCVDRKITEDDLKLFCFRDSCLGDKYKFRHEDEMRHWISLMHSRGVSLMTTALIGFSVHYEEMFEETEADEIEPYWNQRNISDMERAIEDGLVNCYTHGYEHAHLDNLQDLIGMTMRQCKEYRKDLIEYLDDFNREETYRYLSSQEKRLRKVDVYAKMMSFDPASYILPDCTSRSERVTDYSERGAAHNSSLGRQVISLFEQNCTSYGWSLCSDRCWHCDYRPYIYRFGVERRLYSLEKPTYRSRSLPTYEEFKEVIQAFCHDEDHLKSMYQMFLDYMPGLNYDFY